MARHGSIARSDHVHVRQPRPDRDRESPRARGTRLVANVRTRGGHALCPRAADAVSARPSGSRTRDRLGFVLAALVPFLFYLRTAAPTVYGLDSAELTTGAYALGIVHAPGAPLYLLLGHVFTW